MIAGPVGFELSMLGCQTNLSTASWVEICALSSVPVPVCACACLCLCLSVPVPVLVLVLVYDRETP